MPVDTAKVKDRRQVMYTSIGDVLADAERLSLGQIKTLGNWSPGQIFRHLATSYESSIDGSTMALPWYMKLLGRLFKNQMLKGPMAPGFKLPDRVAQAMLPAPTSTEEGLTALRSAIARLESEPKRSSSPAFGAMTKGEWDRFHLVHSALHMSFLVPANQ